MDIEMITETLYYGMKVVHNESGRKAKIAETDLFVKLNDFAHEWTQCVAYVVDDKSDAKFVRSVDSFRAAFELDKGEKA